MKRSFSLPLLALLLAGAAAAEIPGLSVKNARLETGSAASGLRSALRQAATNSREPYWVAWSVPMIEGESYACCFGKDYGASTCFLEGKNQGWGNTDRERMARKPDQKLNVLVRMEGGQVDEIRAFSESCPLDAGQRRFVWLGAAKPEESVDFVADLADDRGSHEKASNAYAVLALHRNSGADAALERLASAPRSSKERDQPIFWLGQRRGGRGVQFLSGLATADPDEDVREKALFSLSQSRQPEAVETVLEAARSDKSAKVRGHALFCLSQTDSPKAGPAILEAIKTDPAESTRKQGIFALSQLRGGEGTPMLITLGRETEDREVRREVIFWLSQSKDPAAVAFIDKFLED